MLTATTSQGTITIPANKNKLIIAFNTYSSTAIHVVNFKNKTQYVASSTLDGATIWQHGIKFILQSGTTFSWNAWFARYTCNNTGTSPQYDASGLEYVNSILAF